MHNMAVPQNTTALVLMDSFQSIIFICKGKQPIP